MNSANEIDLVLAVRAAIKAALPVRDSTAQEYLSVTERLERDGVRPEDAQSRSDYYRRRAAVIWAAIESGRAALTARDRATRSGDAAALATAVNELERVVSILRRYPPDPKRERGSGKLPLLAEAMTWSSIVARRQSHSSPPVPRSKRKGLGALMRIAEWQGVLLSQVSKDHQAAVAVSLLSGVRPAEIAKGVIVKSTPDGISITVAGAKCGVNRGQASRTLLISTDSAAGRLLAELAKDGQVTITDSPKRLSDAIASAARRAWPQLRIRVSAYSIRHAVASQLKASGVPADAIAKCLGHVATRSASSYGRACLVGDRTPIFGVQASAPVRDTAHLPPKPPFDAPRL